MTSIKSLQRQLQSQNRELEETGRLINELTQMLAEERNYTKSLQKEQKLEPVAIAPKEPSPSKAEKVAAMSDDQLLHAMSHPKRIAELFKNL
jgi:predicted Holliday junction resolvase-like endonuclease